MSEPIPPLHRTITVSWAPEAAFRRFTEQIDTWWPIRSHSVEGARADRVVFEGSVGGRIYEVSRDGAQHAWGTVTAWEPPNRVAFTWHPGMKPETAQQIDVVFRAVSNGTKLELTHTGWERLGDLAKKARKGYPIGWSYVLLLYADRKSSPLVLALNGVMWVLRAVQRRGAKAA